jgi:hypothetical protein
MTGKFLLPNIVTSSLELPQDQGGNSLIYVKKTQIHNRLGKLNLPNISRNSRVNNLSVICSKSGNF